MTNTRMSLVTLVAGLVVSFMTVDAQSLTLNAKDVILKDQPLENWPLENWTGAYFGAYFGSGTSNNISQSVHENSSSSITEMLGSASIADNSTTSGSGHLNGNASGSMANLFVGYNYQLRTPFVVGGQAEGTFFSDIASKETGPLTETTSRISVPNPGTAATFFSTDRSTAEWSESLRSVFSLIVRGGYLAKPTWLLYVLAGATEGNFVCSSNDDNFGGKRSDWILGYTVGAGLEHQLNQHWSLRAEYRYLHSNVDHTVSSSNSGAQTQTAGASFTLAQTQTGGASFTFQNSSTRRSTTDFNFNVGLISIVYQF